MSLSTYLRRVVECEDGRRLTSTSWLALLDAHIASA